MTSSLLDSEVPCYHKTYEFTYHYSKDVLSVTKQILLSSVLVGWVFLSQKAHSQQSISVEERFQDVFLTAGYCTAFGAALGTALLAWTEDPTENLKYVAIGASLGFIGGSVLGTYVVLAPVAYTPHRQDVSPKHESHLTGLIQPTRGAFRSKQPRLSINPEFDTKTTGLVGIRGTFTVASF